MHRHVPLFVKKKKRNSIVPYHGVVASVGIIQPVSLACLTAAFIPVFPSGKRKTDPDLKASRTDHASGPPRVSPGTGHSVRIQLTTAATKDERPPKQGQA